MSLQLALFLVLSVCFAGAAALARLFYTRSLSTVAERARLQDSVYVLSKERDRLAAELHSSNLSAQGYREALNLAEAGRAQLLADLESAQRVIVRDREKHRAFLASLDGKSAEDVARAIAESFR